ncbi:MAG: RAD55 family ATPase [Archaeoglobaceae archaeon]
MKDQKLVLRRGIPTGIALLDKRLDGGLPAGSFVCLYADPIAMPEAFLYQFATAVKSYYVTTNRPAKYITRDMEMLRFSTKNVFFVDVFTQYYLNEYGQFVIEDRYRDKEIFDFLADKFNELNGELGEFVVVVDNLSFFLNLNVEWGLKEWLMNRLYSIAKEKENLVYVYLVKNLHTSDIVNRVLDFSDVVINVEAERVGERVVTKFALPKIRGKRPIMEFFRFVVDEGVQIDTSRDIA